MIHAERTICQENLETKPVRVTDDNRASIIGYTDTITAIWGEKREKRVGGKESQILFINIPDPNVSINDLSNHIFAGIKALPVETAYNWSLNWGRTWITLSFDELTVDYLHAESDEAKKRIVLHTDRIITPQSRLKETPQGKKYFIAISNEPCTIEGLTLQTERMIDELVWCLGLKYRNKIKDPIEAYKLALNELNREGYDIYVLNTQDILDLRRNDERYAVRIYGNILGENKVTEVIGAVGPLESCEKPQSLPIISDFPIPLQKEATNEREVSLQDGIILNMGICVLKRPHIGHMLLAGTLEIARRSLGGDLPVVIQANDSGTRMIQTIAHIADEHRGNPEEIIKRISSGDINSESLEAYYRNRHLAKRRTIVRVTEALKLSRTTILGAQTQEHLSLFEKFWERSAKIIPESNVPLEYGPHEKLNTPKWNGYGVSFSQINGKAHMLQLNGVLTASATRAAVMNYASNTLNAKTHVYIDGDRSVTDAMTILKAFTDIEGIQYNGAAIGFGFKICSGTNGNSIPMDHFMEKYHERNLQGSLLEDIVFLINTRYQIKLPNNLPFYDYANPEAFIDDLMQVNHERNLFLIHAAEVIQKIESLIAPDVARIQYIYENAKKRKRLDYQVALILRASKNDKERPETIFLKQETVLVETPEVQSLIDKNIHIGHMTYEEAEILVLTQIANKQIDLRSNILSELQKHGYRDTFLIEAIHKLFTNKYEMTKINNILFQQLTTIENIVQNAKAIDRDSAEDFVQRYRYIIRTLFKREI